MNFVFESVNQLNKYLISNYLKKDRNVWLIEPFYAFHHVRTGFYPACNLEFYKYISAIKNIKIIRAEQIQAKDIYPFAADMAVKAIENVYPFYRKRHQQIINFICRVLQSETAENVFKIGLGHRLAEFYSLNILMQRVSSLIGDKDITYYTDVNTKDYLSIQIIISEAGLHPYEHPHIRFPFSVRLKNEFFCFLRYLHIISKLCAQTIASRLISTDQSFKIKTPGKKNFSYAVSLSSPMRQLRNNQRRADYIVDHQKISPEDVLYIPIVNLSEEQKKQLFNFTRFVVSPPKAGKMFSNYDHWKFLLKLSLFNKAFRNMDVVYSGCMALFVFFSWKKLLDNVGFKHFITHCDFGPHQVARNIALKQAGVQTWYYTDSMNLGYNFSNMDKNGSDMLHPFWTYLDYDHFVTWSQAISDYFKFHPGSFRHDSHIVGCIWGSHVAKKDSVSTEIILNNLKISTETFLISVFDTTYSVNGPTEYAEGVLFAQDILYLADKFNDTYILFKQKKDRFAHPDLDPIWGVKLLKLYQRMDNHPRIFMYSKEHDASDIISKADLIISFPFTSTTFEALSVRKPAIWHDPLGLYRNTPYGKIPDLTTHGYDELVALVQRFKQRDLTAYENPIDSKSPLADPFCDGKAIDRFRNLLISNL